VDGTFDISILEVGDGVVEVLATNGDTHLGGDDIDDVIINWLIDTFKKENSIDLKTDKMALQRLKESAEKAKKELSQVSKTNISIPFITATASGPKHISVELTRANLENMTKALIDKSRKPCEDCLKDSKLSKEQIDEVILVGGSTRMPAIQAIAKEIFGKDPKMNVNPDEVVALGAAVQGGVLTGEVKDVILLDVTPLTLGIETEGAIMTPMIERNTTIPKSVTQVFSTAVNNQPAVDICVYQGERKLAKDNKMLGKFQLSGIPPAPRGVPQIEVTFEIDSNGILEVKAKDKASGKEQKVTIKGSSGLDKSEIERMVREAQDNKENDEKKEKIIKTKNHAEQVVNNCNKFIDDYKDKIVDEDKKELQELIAKIESVKDGESFDDITVAIESLEKKMSHVGSSFYDKSSDASQTSEESQSSQQ
jgi:molecular chaperone DnaK